MIFNPSSLTTEAQDFKTTSAMRQSWLGFTQSQSSALKRSFQSPFNTYLGCHGARSDGLQVHISHFVGPKYRYRAWDPRFNLRDCHYTPFLLRALYGDIQVFKALGQLKAVGYKGKLAKSYGLCTSGRNLETWTYAYKKMMRGYEHF
jgi:hypothetical protein